MKIFLPIAKTIVLGVLIGSATIAQAQSISLSKAGFRKGGGEPIANPFGYSIIVKGEGLGTLTAEDDGDDSAQEILDYAIHFAKAKSQVKACEDASQKAGEAIASLSCYGGQKPTALFINSCLPDPAPSCESQLSSSGLDNVTPEQEDTFKDIYSHDLEEQSPEYDHESEQWQELVEEGTEIAWTQVLVTAVARCKAKSSIRIDVKCF